MVDCGFELSGDIVVQIDDIFIAKLLFVGLRDVSRVFGYGGRDQLQSAIDPILTCIDRPHSYWCLEHSLLACLVMVSLLIEIMLLILLGEHVLLVQWMDHHLACRRLLLIIVIIFLLD